MGSFCMFYLCYECFWFFLLRVGFREELGWNGVEFRGVIFYSCYYMVFYRFVYLFFVVRLLGGGGFSFLGVGMFNIEGWRW